MTSSMLTLLLSISSLTLCRRSQKGFSASLRLDTNSKVRIEKTQSQSSTDGPRLCGSYILASLRDISSFSTSSISVINLLMNC